MIINKYKENLEKDNWLDYASFDEYIEIYANKVLKRRWKEIEPLIYENEESAYL